MVEHTGPPPQMGETAAPGEVRLERDSMGEIAVPAWARWGAQTQRAVANFPISGTPVEPGLIHALGRIKAAAAVVNGRLGVLRADVAEAVAAAGAEVATGQWDDHFPVDVFQTGSGTSSNMNANEVVASLASERLGSQVHPNDHVNASQSSNDVFPSAVHLAALSCLDNHLSSALDHLAVTLRAKAKELSGVVKAGRTHLMDATPVTLGQELGGYATAVEKGVARLRDCRIRLGELALGGTAVGTGINAPAGFASAVIALLAEETGLPLTEAPDHFEAQSSRDALVEASGAVRSVAVSLVKIANDLRWMASGPRAGLAEIRLPDLQPGSSIMPGKVNPVIPEAVIQVAAQVMGNDATVAFAATTGAFELNVAMPVMARNLLESLRIVAAACRLLADLCVAGIEADAQRCRRNAESSPALATVLTPHIGYEEAAKVVREAGERDLTVRQVVIERGLMTSAEIERVLDVEAMTRGGTVHL